MVLDQSVCVEKIVVDRRPSDRLGAVIYHSRPPEQATEKEGRGVYGEKEGGRTQPQEPLDSKSEQEAPRVTAPLDYL